MAGAYSADSSVSKSPAGALLLWMGRQLIVTGTEKIYNSEFSEILVVLMYASRTRETLEL